MALIPYTASSHVSMFTGLTPAEHRVSNGSSLTAEAVDAARVLGVAGFRTGAFVNTGFLAAISENFDVVTIALGKGEKVVDAALDFLGSPATGGRFFLWVHLYDPHKWLNDSSTTDASRQQVRGSEPVDVREFYSYLARLHGLPDDEPGKPFTPTWSARIGRDTVEVRNRADFIHLIDNYDALIRDADTQIERLYAAVEALEPRAPTLWIVTSDHGEGLGGHGVVGHGNLLYQEQVHVPLVFHATDGSLAAQGPRRVDRLVQLVDLFPTFLDVVHADLSGLDPDLHGVSLWPLVDGEPGWMDRPAFSIRYSRPAALVPNVEGRAPRRTVPERFALLAGHRKLILDDAGSREFYDIESDPLELHPADSPDAEALEARLRTRLSAYERNLATIGAPSISDEWMSELEKLGYVQDSDSSHSAGDQRHL